MIEFKFNGFNTTKLNDKLCSEKEYSAVNKSNLENNIRCAIYNGNSFFKEVKNYGELLKYKDMLDLKKYTIKVLNVNEIEKSMQYNPLLNINNDNDIWSIVNVIIENRPYDQDDMINMDAFMCDLKEKLLLKAIIGYVIDKYEDKDKNFKTIFNLLSKHKKDLDEEQNDAKETVGLEYLFENYQKEVKKEVNSSIICWNIYKILTKDNKKEDQIITHVLLAMLAIFSLDKAKVFNSTDEFDFSKNKNNKIAYFLIVSDEGSSVFNFMGDIFINQLTNNYK